MGGPGGLRRDSSGPGREREFVPSAADEVDQWRSAKPLVEAKGARDQRPAVLGSGQSSPSMAETETTVSVGCGCVCWKVGADEDVVVKRNEIEDSRDGASSSIRNWLTR